MMISIATLLLAFLPPYQAVVTDVHDGDTIKVLKPGEAEKIEIRLLGIDAPEVKYTVKDVGGKKIEVRSEKGTQPYGFSSRAMLSQLVYGKTVEVVPKNKDRYGRTVAQIKADGIDVNNKMVEVGAAWWYEQYAKRDTIKQQLQSDAQGHKRGLWADPQPMPPWDFRKKKPEVKSGK